MDEILNISGMLKVNNIELDGETCQYMALAGPEALVDLGSMTDAGRAWDYTANPYGPGTLAYNCSWTPEQIEAEKDQYIFFKYDPETKHMKFALRLKKSGLYRCDHLNDGDYMPLERIGDGQDLYAQIRNS